MMKILFIHKDINRDVNAGGINTVYLKHIEKLQNDNQLYVITSRTGEWNLNAKRYVVSSDKVERKTQIEKIIDEVDPDIIDVFSWGAELLDYVKKEHRAKVIMRADIPMRYYDREAIDEEMAKYCDKIISISNWCDFEWSSIFGCNTIVIPHATDMKKEKNIKKEKNTVVWIGKSTYIKGFDLLFKLPDEFYKNYKLTIVCAPTRFNDENLFNKLKLKGVIFKENLSNYDYRNLLLKSEFVLSTARKEGFCIAVLEAMRLGCIPVVPYWIGGTTDFVNNDNGIVYRNFKECYEKMQNLDNKHEKMQNAIVQTDNYNWDYVVGLSEKVYRELYNES